MDDEAAITQLLKKALSEHGFAVTVSGNGQEALAVANDKDAIIVDVMMPILNGFEFVTQLRQRAIRTPVLFLTAKTQTDDRVHGLEIGGDDYLAKPFKLAELVARINALIRRDRQHKDILEFSDLIVDVRSRKVIRGDSRIYLSNTEFALLEQFMLQPGVVLSKSGLLREVWNDDSFRDENTVEVYVNYLRNKLEAAHSPRLIQTVKGVGYVLQI